ncbi:ABC-type polysaccharide/polyol phosphate export permease [Rhodovulum visakhapatnamense]|uniref:ABC-type polysaccharide/polyol phosphate export permease n=1 Tax=Rhodovulum visakhapatnamense TaxID=364297 RepID=A0A4R8G5L9_9RHOB|nr:ABC-type polysaccharide/polyol phosphate export permease [Rhodovulum visakhapatnamense]
MRHVRKSHRNAGPGLIMNILQTVLPVVSFYAMFTLVGLRGAAIRGDFLIYLMSGVFLFMTFNKTMAAVAGSEGPASAMMQHAPMNTIIAIAAAALGTLYIQILSMVFVGFVYHAAFTPITVDRPVGAMGMLLAWFSGLSVGMVFLALKPWAPGVVGLASTAFQRMTLIASGKMFAANTMDRPHAGLLRPEPLFHCIDPARGLAFVDYDPHSTAVGHPLRLAIAPTVIGPMGECHTRKLAPADGMPPGLSPPPEASG